MLREIFIRFCKITRNLLSGTQEIARDEILAKFFFFRNRERVRLERSMIEKVYQFFLNVDLGERENLKTGRAILHNES